MGTLTGAVVHHRQLHLVLRYPFVSVYKMAMKWLASSLFQGVATTRFVWQEVDQPFLFFSLVTIQQLSNNRTLPCQCCVANSII
jgi:hypothetical protein